MNVRHSLRRSFLALGLLMLSVHIFAQAPATTTPFEPRVGQPGKDVVWVPTPQATVDRMLDMAKVTAQDYLIDLGSGDGRTVITAAKRGARAHGIEYNPDMVTLSQQNAAKEGLTGRATFAKADLFQSDFSQATVVSMFLLPSINLELRPKILNLKAGTRIVSNTFPMGDWQADETSTIENCQTWCTALLWIVPAKVEGTWQLPQGELKLTQQFQMVSGTLTNGTATTPLSGGRLRGDQIVFTAGNVEYVGRVNGNTIQGTTLTNGVSASWRATRAGV
jgi:hypothetical protein